MEDLDECQVTLPVDDVEAPVVQLVCDVQGEASFALIIVETQD